MRPERLYALITKCIDFMWPLAKIIRKIPKIGPAINWHFLIADHSRTLPDADDRILKEWAYLDSFDMLSPVFDYPQTIRTFKRSHSEAGLVDVDVRYGYNGIEARARKFGGVIIE